jgi:hypothetical protein
MARLAKGNLFFQVLPKSSVADADGDVSVECMNAYSMKYIVWFHNQRTTGLASLIVWLVASMVRLRRQQGYAALIVTYGDTWYSGTIFLSVPPPYPRLRSSLDGYDADQPPPTPPP